MAESHKSEPADKKVQSQPYQLPFQQQQTESLAKQPGTPKTQQHHQGQQQQSEEQQKLTTSSETATNAGLATGASWQYPQNNMHPYSQYG